MLKKKLVPPNLPATITEPIRLKRPIGPADYLLMQLDSDDFFQRMQKDSQQHNDKIRELQLKKLALLMGHYKIKSGTNPILELLYHVLQDFVPGFQVEYEKPKGRKTKWNPRTWALLWYDVGQYLKEHPRYSVATACNNLAKRPYWKDWLGKGIGKTHAKTLHNQYIKAGKSDFPGKWVRTQCQCDGAVDWKKYAACINALAQIPFLFEGLKHPLVAQKPSR